MQQRAGMTAPPALTSTIEAICRWCWLVASAARWGSYQTYRPATSLPRQPVKACGHPLLHAYGARWTCSHNSQRRCCGDHVREGCGTWSGGTHPCKTHTHTGSQLLPLAAQYPVQPRGCTQSPHSHPPLRRVAGRQSAVPPANCTCALSNRPPPWAIDRLRRHQHSTTSVQAPRPHAARAAAKAV